MENRIKFLQSVKDKETGEQYLTGTDIDLGKERNEAAVKNKLAVWVDSRSSKEKKPLQDLKSTEKNEGTPKKTTSSVKGNKIETK